MSTRTTMGRVLGMAIMLIGIGFIAILTGAVAHRFLAPRSKKSKKRWRKSRRLTQRYSPNYARFGSA